MICTGVRMTTSIETRVREKTQPIRSITLCFFTQFPATMSTEMAIHIFSIVDHVLVPINAAIAFRLPRNQSPPAMAYISSITDSPQNDSYSGSGSSCGQRPAGACNSFVCQPQARRPAEPEHGTEKRQSAHSPD